MTAIPKKDPDTLLLQNLFQPHAAQAEREALEAGGRFAYYTTADTAASILRNQEIWMRNTRVMNDSMEVEHGFTCLNAAYKSEAGRRLKEILNSCFPGLSDKVEKLFNDWLPQMRADSYISCVSVHTEDEDKHGRLSMWRAYGGTAGVALILNGDPMFGTSEVGVHTSPVAYFNESGFKRQFEKLVAGLEESRELVARLDRDIVQNWIFQSFRFAALGTKHPGFAEEREWRIVATPGMYDTPKGLLVESVETVRGVPQKVLKLQLKNLPEHELMGIALPELLHKIIIGPCDFPDILASALQRLLEERGVENAAQKIEISDIPLRHF